MLYERRLAHIFHPSPTSYRMTIQVPGKPPMETSMRYVQLGNSGLKISNIILGCLSYGDTKWQPWVLEEDEAMKHIKRAYDLGINAFDTAGFYSNGVSEVILGKAIKKHNLPRDEIVVMTKIGFCVSRDPSTFTVTLSAKQLDASRYINQRGLSRKYIFAAVKHSLERLQLDYIDLLQCQRFDPETPIEETMQALHDIVKAGYARYIGMSSCYAWQFQKMQNYALSNGLTPFISMQNLYNATYREEEREVIPLLRDLGIGCIPWMPLAGGFLARSTEEVTPRSSSSMKVNTQKEPFLVTINQRVKDIADKRSISMAQVALAWTLSKEFVTAPIVGVTSIEQLEDLVAGVHIKLTEEEEKLIDEPYLSRAIFGHS